MESILVKTLLVARNINQLEPARTAEGTCPAGGGASRGVLARQTDELGRDIPGGCGDPIFDFPMFVALSATHHPVSL